jgi:putative Mn2+ efflux pump MntP
LKLILFVLPLGLDTFAASAALGVLGLPRRDRLRASLVMAASFEMAMPVVGLLSGQAIGTVVGAFATYAAAAALAGLGAWMLLSDDEGEDEKVGALPSKGGLALIGLGIGISLDELAIGFTIGLLGLSILLAVILIGIQAFAAAQLGLALGARLGSAVREWAEKLAGVTLIGLGVLVLVEKLV